MFEKVTFPLSNNIGERNYWEMINLFWSSKLETKSLFLWVFYRYDKELALTRTARKYLFWAGMNIIQTVNTLNILNFISSLVIIPIFSFVIDDKGVHWFRSIGWIQQFKSNQLNWSRFFYSSGPTRIEPIRIKWQCVWVSNWDFANPNQTEYMLLFFIGWSYLILHVV